MVQLIDLMRIDAVKLKENEVKVVNIVIEEQELAELNNNELYDKINVEIRDTVARAALAKDDKVYFQVYVIDTTANDEELNFLYSLVGDIIAANLLTVKSRDREPRLTVPVNVRTNGLIGLIWLRKLVNMETICNVFGGMVNINGREKRLV